MKMVHFLAIFYALLLDINHICAVSNSAEDFFKNVSFHFQTELVVHMLQLVGKIIRGVTKRAQLLGSLGQVRRRAGANILLSAKPLSDIHRYI